MQVFATLPGTAPNPAKESPNLCGDTPRKASATALQPLWPDYFARRGQPDATSWHYRGYWKDTWHVWRSYYQFVFRHPIIAATGQWQFYRSLVYRIFGPAAGDRSALLSAALTPLLLPGFPLAALVAVSIARLPGLRGRVPPLFSPFTTMGWTNYCVMLALVFTLHGYRQRCLKVHPAKLTENSSKAFWNHFFSAHLPAGHYPTRQIAVYREGKLHGRLPRQDVIIKPDGAGAGHHLRAFRWNETSGRFECNDRELPDSRKLNLTPEGLMQHIRSTGVDMIVERWEKPRPPLPVCTLRVLTLNIDNQPELICAAFLPAPAGSASTAYFDLDTYLVDVETNRITEPLSPKSDGSLSGTDLPELGDIVRACLQMHSHLKEHLQISWDIVPTAKGPVYLEGNVFPPGCDYKLSLFKNKTNFRYLLDRILGKRPASQPAAAET